MLDLNVYLSIYTHYLSPLMLQVSVIHNHVQVCVPDATLRDCESVGGCYLTLRDCESVGGCYLTLCDCESVGGCYLTLCDCE